MADETDVQNVELTERTYQGITQLYGELHIGSVPSMQQTSLSFRLTNTSVVPVRYSVISTSCTCTDVKLRAGSLEPGESSSSGRATVIVPRARGNGLPISEFRLYRERGDERPVGTIVVRANVKRPFIVSDLTNSYSVDPSERFENKILVDIDQHAIIKNMKLLDVPGPLSARIVATGGGKGVIEIEGEGRELLEAGRMTFRAVYSADKNGREIADTIQLQFFDATAARAFPSIVSTSNGGLKFSLFRGTGEFVEEELKITDQRGMAVEAEISIKKMSANFVVIRMQLEGEKVPEFLRVCGKDFAVRVVVSSD